MQCFCQSGLSYNLCCRPFHDGKIATTAEQLMRSRYSAYVQQNADYLHKTWHNSTRPTLKQLRSFDAVEWLGLDIIRTELGKEQDEQGLVEFIAKFAQQGKIQQLQETSHFIREKGKWFYLNGDYSLST
ncbi:YchJ family protein [Thiofilum flexile]|uniref:YchJ family protein n=1 Tax=Thiofilum flexile TaxID=125627 RepID=UPI00039F7974|nr:YchJ family protein [Thiofilum flexile]